MKQPKHNDIPETRNKKIHKEHDPGGEIEWGRIVGGDGVGRWPGDVAVVSTTAGYTVSLSAGGRRGCDESLPAVNGRLRRRGECGARVRLQAGPIEKPDFFSIGLRGGGEAVRWLLTMRVVCL